MKQQNRNDSGSSFESLNMCDRHMTARFRRPTKRLLRFCLVDNAASWQAPFTKKQRHSVTLCSWQRSRFLQARFQLSSISNDSYMLAGKYSLLPSSLLLLLQIRTIVLWQLTLSKPSGLFFVQQPSCLFVPISTSPMGLDEIFTSA